MTVVHQVLHRTYVLRLVVGGRSPRRWKQALSLQPSAFGIVAVLQRNSVQRHRIAVAPAGAGNSDERPGAGTAFDPGRQRGLDIAPGVRDSHQDAVVVSGCQHVEPALRWTRSSCLARVASTSGHAAPGAHATCCPASARPYVLLANARPRWRSGDESGEPFTGDQSVSTSSTASASLWLISSVIRRLPCQVKRVSWPSSLLISALAIRAAWGSASVKTNPDGG